ncbi:hypothetical protein B0H12DRAFT_1234243 [Mycena haematopus]|nr:hypothetical protein B0H12DRAFT_1234243 [Mycena haematopus]
MRRIAVLSTLTRPSRLRAPLVLRRRIQPKQAVNTICPQGDATLQSLANTFQGSIKIITASYERRVRAFSKDLKSSRDELTQARIDLAVNAVKHTHVTEALRIKLEKARNNLTLRSALGAYTPVLTSDALPHQNRNTPEIITITLQEQWKYLKRSNPVQGPGVQKVIDAIVAGGFNNGGMMNITFEDAKNIVVRKVMATGGIETIDIGRALGVLYEELSKHDHTHTGVDETLTVRQGEQLLEESIAVMCIIHFARCVYGSGLDAAYYDSENRFQFTLSTLPRQPCEYPWHVPGV